MQRLLTHSPHDHGLWLTLAAVVVCAVGLLTALALLAMVPGRGRPLRSQGLAAALVSGLTVWAAHFILMLDLQQALSARFSLAETLASLAVALVGLSVTIVMVRERRGRGSRLLAGAVAAASIAAMQGLGLLSLRFSGTLDWQPMITSALLPLGLVLGMATTVTAARRATWAIPAGALLGVLAIGCLHIGVLDSVSVVTDSLPKPAAAGLSAQATLGWIAATIGLLVTLVGIATGIGYWTRSHALYQMREAIDAMSDGLGFYDADDRLVIWNARYAEINSEVGACMVPGMSFRDVLGVSMKQGLHLDAIGREEAWIAERMEARKGLSSSLEQALDGGRWLRVQDRRTAAGGIVTVCNDISDLKASAQALADARDTAEAANRAKSEFLANMSHEIRTPLNGVIGLAQALARTELTPEQTEMLNLIQSSGHTLQTLLSDILDLARVESGRLELADQPFDLTRAVQEAAQLYTATAAEKGLQFFVDIDPDAAVWVQGDVVRLKQVLTNLVSNAVKFTAQGFVSLTVTRSARADGVPLLRFTVEDTGVGFDAEARARLFMRFEQADGTITRRFGGTGLGLAICRQLAEMMQGDLDCESEPGGGSAFILTIPMREVEAQVRTADVALAAVSDDDRRVRVLVADDHPTNRKVVELILGQAAIDLTQVEDGAQALSACRAETFDLILMDMQMPVMDGLTATREIRLHELAMGFAPVPIVMLTANALPDHIAASKAAGADRHLAKPFDAGELLSIVAELTAEPRALAA